MTNFEYLMQAQTPEQFHRLYYDHFEHGCRQVNRKVWKNLCLTEEYRGKDGCYKCMMDFWKQEYKGGIHETKILQSDEDTAEEGKV